MFRARFATSPSDVIEKLNLNLRDIEAELARRPQAGPAATKSQSLPIPSPSAVRHDATAGIDEGDIKHMTAAWVSGLTGGGSTALHSHSQYMLAAMRGAVNGVCELDANSLIPIGRVPASLLGGVRYQGVWNATTNTPTLATSPDSTTKGFYYKVSVAGTWNSVSWAIGDWIISNGTSWDKIDNMDAVTSVAGRTGAVVLAKSDVGLDNVDNTSDANKPVSTATQTALNNKQNLSTALADNAESSTLPTTASGTITSKLQQIRDYLKYVLSQLSGKASLIHASRHSAGGADAVSIDTSQISNMSAFMRTVNDDASAADARNTLDTPPKNHASASTDFGAAGEINYGHVQKENTVTNGSLKVPTSNAVYAAILANKFVDQNSGTYGNGVLVGVKGGYAGLTAAGQTRIVFMSAGYETGCGLYNETDGKWLIKFDGQSGLVTDYNPVADANTNILATIAWVLGQLANTTVGNADKVDGYHIVYTTYAGKGSASDTFYFTAG